MTCREAVERIEAVAAGDEPEGEAFRAHVEGCPRCRAALARARALERALAARPAVDAPPRFAAAVAARVRHEYWRSEQRVDRMFNVAVAAGFIAIVAGTLALVNLSAVAEGFGAGLSALFALAAEARSTPAARVPALSVYLLAGGFLVTTLLVWSWAERSGGRS
jgi:anti-sigma factor RsiW